ncbi:MAG: hypothetical protein H3C45_10420, partial [Bacteroidia bacterium]|nr:hypothetical protein [Bacteroidia bacterium]
MNQSTLNSNKYIMYYAVFCTAIYGILAIVFLSTNYVEGDDASTVLYHLMGRDKGIQMPYSAYHSGFDFILSFISPDEVILRSFATIVSFIFGGLVLFLSGVLLFKLEILNPKMLLNYLLLLPFIIPEFIFSSGLYNPTSIGFTFILLSTFSLLKYIQTKHIKHFFVFTILFSFGIPFRWSLVFYLPVYLAIFILKYSYKPPIKQLLIFAAFCIMAICLAFCTIAITGYTPINIVQTYLWGKGYIENTERSILSIFANAVSYYTIPFVFCLIAGTYGIIKKRVISNKFWLLLILTISPFFIMGFHTSFKYSITYMPILLLIGAIGYEQLMSKKMLKYSLTLSIAFIWFIGIKLNSSKLAYGPGFSNKITIYADKNINNNPDRRIDKGKIQASLAGGLLMPTAEGPRPLLGYFYVVFGGEYKKYINEQEKKRLNLIKIVKENDATLFQDRRTSYLQCDLYRLGYKSSAFDFNGQYSFRNFINNKSNDTLILNVIPDEVNKAEWIINKHNEMNKPIILRSS